LILEAENDRLSTQIKDQLRNHLVKSSIAVPCSLKKHYGDVLAKSFCPKPSPKTPYGSAYFFKANTML
jgi:hypothetical protein